MNETDFPHVALVKTWLQRLARQHPEEREFLDGVAAEVATRRQATLHYGALGLRVRVRQARDAGECSTTFHARADAVLFGLEVLADDGRRFGLAPDVVTAVVETALRCADDEIALIARAVHLAGRLRWRELVESRTLLEAWTAQQVPAGWRSLLDTFAATLQTLEETPPQPPPTAEPPVSWSRRTPDREIENGTIRIGKLEFPVESAELRYTPVPNGTIEVALEIRGERREGLSLDLYPPPLEGRVLGDLTGQVQIIASPTKPALDSTIPNMVDTVAGIYVGTHESVHDSRIEWGQADARSIRVRWTGSVDDLDYYDGSVPRQPLVVDARALAIEIPYEAVKWGGHLRRPRRARAPRPRSARRARDSCSQPRVAAMVRRHAVCRDRDRGEGRGAGLLVAPVAACSQRPAAHRRQALPRSGDEWGRRAAPGHREPHHGRTRAARSALPSGRSDAVALSDSRWFASLGVQNGATRSTPVA